jgi:hypothetical protein
MKRGEERIIGHRWVRGYRCECGKLFEYERIGFHIIIFTPDVCPNCGTPRKNFEEGAIMIERYILCEKLWWIFDCQAVRDRSVKFRPFPAEYDNGIPVATKQELESAKIVRLS